MEWVSEGKPWATYRTGLSAAQLAAGATQQSSKLVHAACEIKVLRVDGKDCKVGDSFRKDGEIGDGRDGVVLWWEESQQPEMRPGERKVVCDGWDLIQVDDSSSSLEPESQAPCIHTRYRGTDVPILLRQQSPQPVPAGKRRYRSRRLVQSCPTHQLDGDRDG